MPSVRVGLFPPVAQLDTGPEQLQATLARIADLDVDHLCVGDHVSFFVGAGSDGLISAASMLTAQAELPVYVGLYLLPLRHPVPVARQLATLSQLAPGRLTLGVGIGGEDPHEIEICGADPRTRGRRMDECPPIPLIVGGRSDAAVSRAARLGDGWLGIWVSPRRYAAVRDQIAQQAAEAGRTATEFDHALNVWCGFGATREAAREPLAAQMQAFYQMPFEPFERYSPYGTPEQVAEFLHPYIEAGCSTFNVIPCATYVESAIAAVGEVRALLTRSVYPVGTNLREIP
jgi:alkanesulfonate monooxygenase SsuD/methylene tetrahydromethanopterin reductase-like flavin-dependent oxidoreductase (luciferase family)